MTPEILIFRIYKNGFGLGSFAKFAGVTLPTLNGYIYNNRSTQKPKRLLIEAAIRKLK